MKYPLKTFIGTLIVLSSLILAGCPKGERTVRQLREKSAEMSTYGTQIVKAFGDAYEEGEISQDQLRTLNVATGAFVTGIGVYRDALAEAERLVRNGDTLPPDTIGKIERILDAQVIATFFKILERVAGLPIERSQVIQGIISGIRITILALKNAFGQARQLVSQDTASIGGKYAWIG